MSMKNGFGYKTSLFIHVSNNTKNNSHKFKVNKMLQRQIKTKGNEF